MKNFTEFILENKHDDIAKGLIEDIRNSESKVDIFADYKRGIRIGDNYISVIKNSNGGRLSSKFFFSNKDSYALVIDGIHYDVSNKICLNLWKIMSDKSNDGIYQFKSNK